MMLNLRQIVCALVALLLFPLGASEASEEIRSFDVVIDVQPDGELEVSETILVEVAGEQIMRGIYRDFPLTGPAGGDIRPPVTFSVLSVTRNGQSEPYRETERGEALRVRIGESDVLLPVPSQQRYQIRYRTQGQLQAYEGFDELYWNVTGNDWAFTIRSASVEVRLPDEAEILQVAGYTGPPGSRRANFEEVETAPGLIRARTTGPLPPGDGFTLAVAWPSGLVEIPQMAGFMGQPLEQMAAVGATLLGSGILFLFWLAVGLDPRGKLVHPRSEPPTDLGPAAARYVQRQDYDDRCATAAILNMAVKGAIRIERNRDSASDDWRDFSLLPLGSQGKGLTPAEAAAYDEMFPGDYALVLKGDEGNGGRMDRTRKALRLELEREHHGASFKRNGVYTAAGLAAGLVIALGLFWLSGPLFIGPALAWVSAAILGAAVILIASIFWRVIKDRAFTLSEFRARLPFFSRRLGKLPLPLVLFLVVVCGFLLTKEIRMANLSFTTGNIAIFAGAAYGVAAALFHFLMAAPTKAGRRLMNEIEGFALYLRNEEEGRLKTANSAQLAPELFERYLPYAIAFGISEQWSAKFATVLAASTSPAWYLGDLYFVPSDFDRQLGEAVTNTSEPPSSSEGTFSGGSAGGGSSGGGGGGGGGGGW